MGVSTSAFSVVGYMLPGLLHSEVIYADEMCIRELGLSTYRYKTVAFLGSPAGLSLIDFLNSLKTHLHYNTFLLSHMQV